MVREVMALRAALEPMLINDTRQVIHMEVRIARRGMCIVGETWVEIQLGSKINR